MSTSPVQFLGIGICYASVCVPAEMPVEEVVAGANRLNHPGIGCGWQLSGNEKFSSGETHPCPCAEDAGRVHRLLERGRAVPDDDQVAALTRVYGPPSGWYPPELVALLVPDVRWCEGCGDELGVSLRPGATYHDAVCQDAHRERLHSSGPGVSVEGLENAGGASPTPPANTPLTTGGQDGR
jgi:hypothetical protein